MSTARDRQQQRAAKRASKRPTGKQIEELANRAEASGCDRCGTRFAELLPYLICKTHGGGLAGHVAEVKKSFPTEADWQEAQRQKFAERLEVTAQFVRTLRP